jgi:VWFA-related protein
MPSRVTLVSCALTVIAVLSLAAQAPTTQKPPDPQRPAFRTEANYVRVDVFPTKDGSPVKDLTVADFELLEDGVPQKIDAFEFVQVRAGMGSERRDPNTIAESREALKDPRARVFVLFLDVPHVTIHGAWNVREPLVRLIDRILAPEDLIGIMIPRMSASDILFARKTEVVAGGLRDRWPWGERFTLADDEREIMYKACYPWDTEAVRAVVKEMIDRRRERMALDSLYELVNWLRDQREERKAILTISEGWLLFKRNNDLTRPRVIDPYTGALEPIPGPEPIGTGPDGRLRIGNTMGTETISKTECDRDRLSLSQLDNDRYFRDIIDAANRGNSSFYTVDPRGLPVFDTPIGPDPPPPPYVDHQILTRRLDALHVLSNNTDGLAVVNSNDVEKGLRRMADDLTSYYLLGYYSTNTKTDGRFRTIKVRVNRPGVDVRARKGYKAASEKEVTEARRAAAPAPVPEHVALAREALAGLARLRGSAPFHASATVLRGDVSTVWVAGELASAAKETTTADITVTAGESTSSATVSLSAGQRGFVAPLVLKRRVAEPIDVRVRVSSASGGLPVTDMVQIDPGEGLPHPLLFRRGPSTGNRVEAAGEPSFSRTERARFELPLAAEVKVTAARILDRNGTAIELPVTLSERTDPSGQRWSSAEAVLAPLAAGDYLIEITGSIAGAEQKRLIAFRVIR